MPRSASPVTLTLGLDPQLAQALAAAADARGWTSESLASECIVQHLEIAIRHRVLVERMEVMDAVIHDIAELLGEMSAAGSSVDISSICRYGQSGTTTP
ncbi:MAG: hypothetical protein ACFE0R_09270 [Salinarimonas sp.]